MTSCSLGHHHERSPAVQGVHVQQMTMEPYQISPEFFNQRMKEVSLEKSVAVFDDLKYAGILKDDNCSHFIQYDDWCAFLLHARAEAHQESSKCSPYTVHRPLILCGNQSSFALYIVESISCTAVL